MIFKNSLPAAAILLFLFSCKIRQSNESNKSKLEFSTLSPDNVEIEDTFIHSLSILAPGSSIKACLISYSGKDASPEFELKSKKAAQEMTTNAVEKWQKILSTHPKWPHKTPLPVKFEDCVFKGTEGNEDLPAGANIVVAIYPSELAWSRIVCKGAPSDECRSFARMLDARINMYTFDLEERYIAHEIGHLLGLADLYLEPGSNEFSLPQPASALIPTLAL